jgi:signal peptidase I
MEEEKNITKEIIEWAYCIVIAVVLALAVRYFIGTPTIVQQISMKPTLIEGERLILNRWGRTTKTMPQRGDIITFEAPSKKGYSSQAQVDQSKPIALYENEPEGLWDKFRYYVLEIGKDSYIKRVIALPGEHVQIKDGKVYINEKELEEKYLQSGIVTDVLVGFNDFVVPENCVFAMGDNRNHSTDCRAFGCIPLERIESTVWIRIWPFNVLGGID